MNSPATMSTMMSTAADLADIFSWLPKEKHGDEPFTRRMLKSDANDLITNQGLSLLDADRFLGVRTTYEGDAKPRILGNFGSYTTER